MTIKEFENKYWYMSELKALAKSLAIPFNSKIRKDQLERMIIQFLETGTVNKKTVKLFHWMSIGATTENRRNGDWKKMNNEKGQ